METYVSGDGPFADGIPDFAIKSFDWRCRVVIPTSDVQTRSVNVNERLTVVVQAAYMRLRRIEAPITPFPPVFGIDLRCYRCASEVGYVANLRRVGEENLQEWSGLFAVSDRATFHSQPVLSTEFRFIPKWDTVHWPWMKWERYVRGLLYVLVSYTMKE